MKPINRLLTLISLTAILIIIERLSPTTKIVLQPFSFLRLHEVFQMSVIILISVLLLFFIFREVTDKFATLKTKKGIVLGTLVIVGIYFYSTGNGLHEVSSYLFNMFCHAKKHQSLMCGSMYFNDYYFGNILYFVGALLVDGAIMLLEIGNPNKTFTKKDITVTIANGLVFGLGVTAYAAFDIVVIGLIYAVIGAIMSFYLLLSSKQKYIHLPYTIYHVYGYTLAAVLTAIIRFA